MEAIVKRCISIILTISWFIAQSFEMFGHAVQIPEGN